MEIIFSIFRFSQLPLVLILSLRKLQGFLFYDFLKENSLCLLCFVCIDVHVILSDKILRSYCLNDEKLTVLAQVREIGCGRTCLSFRVLLFLLVLILSLRKLQGFLLYGFPEENICASCD